MHEGTAVSRTEDVSMTLGMSHCRVAVQTWRRKRQFICLVAEQRSSKELVASCILSLAAPDAVRIILTPSGRLHPF